MKIITGLGNPGTKYDQTRHNIGFQAVEHIIQNIQNIKKSSTKFNSITHSKIGEEPIVLNLTKTFMNHSGKATNEVLSFLNMPSSTLIILYDDMDLPFGEIRIRDKGGSGGHNGMQSVIDFAGTNEITRLKIGIGRPFQSNDPIQHVLGKFTSEEKEILPALLKKIYSAIYCLVEEGIENAMNQFN